MHKENMEEMLIWTRRNKVNIKRKGGPIVTQTHIDL